MTGVQTCALPICFPVTIGRRAGEHVKKHGLKSLAHEERNESEKEEPESRGPDTEAKEEQPESKPIRDAIARNIFRAVDAYKSGMKRHREATQTAGHLAGETAKIIGKLASVTHEAGRRAGEHVKKHGLKSLAHEEFEYWVNSLIEEGYDLSDYTWDDMYVIYLDEAAKRTPRRKRGAKPSDQEWQAGRSDAGKRVSGDENTGPRYYTLGRARGTPVDAPTPPGERPVNTPRLAAWEKDDIQYRKANLKAGKTHKVGGERGLPESFDNFDIIFEYLVAEGYADTNEAALVIMANMSEEWKQSIVEGSTGFSVPSRIDYFNNRRDELKNRYKQDVGPRIPGPSGGGQYGEPPAPKAMGVRLARGTSSSKRGVESKNNA